MFRLAELLPYFEMSNECLIVSHIFLNNEWYLTHNVIASYIPCGCHGSDVVEVAYNYHK